jgi:hypothetical protein
MDDPQMSLSNLEQHLYAYFLVIDAPKVTVDGRFYRREEFIGVFKDRIRFGAAGAGKFSGDVCEHIATDLVDKLIASGALTTARDKLTVGELHQFEPAAYKQTIQSLAEQNPIVAASKGQGEDFWKKAFTDLGV